MTTHWLLAVVVTLSLVTAGCAYVPQKGSHEIDFAGTVEQKNGSFQMVGEVRVISGAAQTRNYSAVSVVLYESPGTVAERIRLGKMSTDSSVAPTQRPINLTRELTPEYVLIESLDFWDDDELDAVIAFRWTGEEYEMYFVDSKDERFDH